MSEIRTLRPGLLVSMRTSIKGNTHYLKVNLEGAHINENGEERAKWETERVITDPVEQKTAAELRGRISYLVRRQCARSEFGLLCPDSNADKLIESIAEARVMADEFNAKAKLTTVAVNVIYGRIAQDDVEATKAITAELRSYLDDMKLGLRQLDAAAVRKVCNEATQSRLGEMLSEDAKARMDNVIKTARNAATKIAKAGESAAVKIDKQAIAEINKARTAFLDLDMEAESIATPTMDGRSLDLDPDIKAASDEYVAKARRERRAS